MRRTTLLVAAAGMLAAASVQTHAQAPAHSPAAHESAAQPPAAQASGAPSATTESPAGKPDLERAQKTASEVCIACHGPSGNSVVPVNPSLAGQPAEYISLQLAHF